MLRLYYNNRNNKKKEGLFNTLKMNNKCKKQPNYKSFIKKTKQMIRMFKIKMT